MKIKGSCFVCEHPKIWVFDDLLSEGFLKHVDSLFDSGKVPATQYNVFGKVRTAHSVLIDVDDVSRELIDIVREIAHVHEVEPCTKLMVSDLYGDAQDAHVDHASTQDLAIAFENLGFLDLSKQSKSEQDTTRVVPTVSLVVYFDNVGGISFPKAHMPNDTITAQRGRIVMFHNYIDNERPAHNAAALHYGFYFPDQQRKRRLMTMGIMANETPTSVSIAEAIIYCPGVGLLGHDNPSYGVDPRHEHTVAPPSPRREDYIVTMTPMFDDSKWCWTMSCSNMAAETVCVVDLDLQTSYRDTLANKIHKAVDPKGKDMTARDRTFAVRYAFADGRMMNAGGPLGSDPLIQLEFFPDKICHITLTAEYDAGKNEWVVVGKDADGEEKCVVRASWDAPLSWLFEQSDRRIMSEAKDKYMWVRYFNPDGKEYGRVEAAMRGKVGLANKGVTDPRLCNLFGQD